jgi:hypothetical protein
MKTCDGEARAGQLIRTRVPFQKSVREEDLHIQREAVQPPIADVLRHNTRIFYGLNRDLRNTFDLDKGPSPLMSLLNDENNIFKI